MDLIRSLARYSETDIYVMLKAYCLKNPAAISLMKEYQAKYDNMKNWGRVITELSSYDKKDIDAHESAFFAFMEVRERTWLEVCMFF